MKPPNSRWTNVIDVTIKNSPPWARIVIVAYNSGEYLKACIDALLAQSFNDFEVTIVDNASPDQCVDGLGILPENFIVLKMTENLGFAEGSNRGAKGTEAPWIITLNPDTVPASDWLQSLKSSIDAHPETSMWASRLVMADRPELLDGFGDVFSIFGMAWRGGYGQSKDQAVDHDVSIFGPCGAAAAYRRDIFETVGGFDSHYFCYLEDIDIALRINLMGGSAMIASRAEVFHVGSTSTKDNPEFKYYHTFKNYGYLLVKCVPLSLLVIMLPLHIVLQFWITARNRHDGLHAARRQGQQSALQNLKPALAKRKTVKRQNLAGIKLWPRLCKSYQMFRKSHIFYWKQ